jgi:hypothetical protein
MGRNNNGNPAHPGRSGREKDRRVKTPDMKIFGIEITWSGISGLILNLELASKAAS